MADAEEEVWVDISVDGDGGLMKRVLSEGEGEDKPPVNAHVTVHYTGTLQADGSKFDSSRDRDDKFKFNVGVGQVIKGWDTGICTMKRGERAILRCSSEYGYGARGSPPKIPGGATLDFDVELFSWKEETKEPGEMESEERSRYAAKQKEAGNAAFKAKEWGRAADAYSEGVKYITFGAGSAHGHSHSHDGVACDGDHGDGGAAPAALENDDAKLALALLNNCAAAQIQMGAAKEAVACCTKALALDDKNVKALFRRGQAQLALGEFSDATADAKAALALDPANKQAAALLKKAAAAKAALMKKEKAMYGKMFA